MSIFDVRHQNRAHRVIQRALNCGRMPHAYLFAGPEGVGKEMLAMRLTKVLLCGLPQRGVMPEGIFSEGDDTPPLAAQGMGHPASGVQPSTGSLGLARDESGQGVQESEEQRAVDACGKCEDCVLVEAGTHPDLHMIYRQLNKQHPDSTIRKQKALVLGVDIIRHFLINPAGMRPSRGRAKVFVVREAERLNESAQNALLKTLEEPFAGNHLILVTSAPDRLLPTIRSRTQRIRFVALEPAALVEIAVRRGLDKAKAETAAAMAAGQVAQLLASLESDEDSGAATAADAFRGAAAGKGMTSIFDAAMAFSDKESRKGLPEALALLAQFYRDALATAVGAPELALLRDRAQQLETLAAHARKRYDLLTLRAALQAVTQATVALASNVNPVSALEKMLMDLRPLEMDRA